MQLSWVGHYICCQYLPDNILVHSQEGDNSQLQVTRQEKILQLLSHIFLFLPFSRGYIRVAEQPQFIQFVFRITGSRSKTNYLSTSLRRKWAGSARGSARHRERVTNISTICVSKIGWRFLTWKILCFCGINTMKMHGEATCCHVDLMASS